MSPRRQRPPRPPAAVLAQVPAGERVLASARASDGAWLLGTRAHLVAAPVDGPARVLPWEEARSADWDGDAARLRVVEVGRWGDPSVEWSLTFTGAPTAVLQLVRERITASILLTRQIDLPDGRGATLAGRRNPDGGPVRWLVDYDPGADPEDPAVAAAVAEAVDRAAAEV